MKPSLKKTLIIGSAMTVFGPLIGVAGTALGMIGAFGSMGQAAPADPAKLSSEIGTVLYSTAVGLSIGLIGACVLIVAFCIWLSNRSHERQNA